jgi:predicted O-methyltransferase YrrM
MPDKFVQMTPALHDYVVRHGTRQDDVLRRLADETASLGQIAVMQVAPDEGAMLTLLVRSIGAKRAIEVGTFTGYSAISIARGLSEDGRLLCCDVNDEWTSIARRYFREAGIADKIEVKIAPAIETIRLLPKGADFDFAFIDADKPSYDAYYEEILARTRPGGLILIDNVLWNGKVVDESDQSESTLAIRKLNEKIAKDDRVDVALVPISDGVTICRKR